VSQQTLRVTRPTKIELIRLKKRVKVAKRLHKVLKDRLIILTQELIMLIRDAVELRQRICDKVQECESLLIKSTPFIDPSLTESYARTRYGRVEGVVGSRVVAGVRVPLIEVRREGKPRESPEYPILLTLASRCFEELLDLTARLGEVESSITRLGAEVARVKRRVNALENVLIPRMENTIKFLEFKFEEREREDKTRMKKVKQILARKEGTVSASA